MKIVTPRHWYLREPPRRWSPTRVLLAACAWGWAVVTARRIARATPVDPGAPVICVGNLTMGGAGKTPVARAIVRRLAEKRIVAHLLLRGHGGRLRGPLQVSTALHDAGDVGDEALMMAGEAPVWISRDRAEGALAAVKAGARALVMDDGHQNPSVRKRLSLIVVDGETRDGEWPFGDGAVFPLGPMREPLAAGLRRADAVVILAPADLPAVSEALRAVFGDRPVLVARLAPKAPPPSGPVVAFAGIGKPWKMERALKAAGCDLVDFAAFPDHAPIAEATLRFLAARADALGARLLTTEKDWVRLPANWRERIDFWPVEARFEDPAALDALLTPILEAAAQAPAS